MLQDCGQLRKGRDTSSIISMSLMFHTLFIMMPPQVIFYHVMPYLFHDRPIYRINGNQSCVFISRYQELPYRDKDDIFFNRCQWCITYF